jgi:hypothetical protein
MVQILWNTKLLPVLFEQQFNTSIPFEIFSHDQLRIIDLTIQSAGILDSYN